VFLVILTENSISQSAFVMEPQCVFCEIGAEVSGFRMLTGTF
jgi:hypothetical protein